MSRNSNSNNRSNSTSTKKKSLKIWITEKDKKVTKKDSAYTKYYTNNDDLVKPVTFDVYSDWTNNSKNKKKTAEFTVTYDLPVPPPTAKPKAVLNVTPSTKKPVFGQTVTLDGVSQSTNYDVLSIEQTAGTSIILKPLTVGIWEFIAPQIEESVSFQLTATKASESSTAEVALQILDPSKTPPPDPNTGNVLYDSNIDGKWNDGVKRTVNKDGAQTPNGKGLYTAASGNPQFIIDGNGIGHLKADAGHGRIYILAKNYNSRLEFDYMFEDTNIDNISFKLRSRHQEGADCINRFGGFGGAIDRAAGEIDFQTEKCHNFHENKISAKIPAHETGKWYHAAISVFDNPNRTAVNLIAEIDGKQVLKGEHKNPQAYYIDKASFDKQSYFWLRINNSKTGQVAFRNVKLVDISDSQINAMNIDNEILLDDGEIIGGIIDSN